MTIEDRIKELGYVLPPAPPVGGHYHMSVTCGNLLFISGQLPCRSDGSIIIGCVGDDMTVEEGYEAAKQTALTMLATIRAEIGSLDKVKRLVKALGMVNCKPGFTQQPQVINGFSETMATVFGEQNGKGARSAVGMILPRGMAIEVEAIFEIEA
jgi:enamine deaminase RidA (YjgF/YER057c/UK114 family)